MVRLQTPFLCNAPHCVWYVCTAGHRAVDAPKATSPPLALYFSFFIFIFSCLPSVPLVTLDSVSPDQFVTVVCMYACMYSSGSPPALQLAAISFLQVAGHEKNKNKREKGSCQIVSAMI
jgi:hypothetical protein